MMCPHVTLLLAGPLSGVRVVHHIPYVKVSSGRWPGMNSEGWSRKCYKDSLRLKRRSHADKPIKNVQLKVNLVDIDQREELPENQLTDRENVRKIQNDV